MGVNMAPKAKKAAPAAAGGDKKLQLPRRIKPQCLRRRRQPSKRQQSKLLRSQGGEWNKTPHRKDKCPIPSPPHPTPSSQPQIPKALSSKEEQVGCFLNSEISPYH